MNEISAFIKETTENYFASFCHVRLQPKEDCLGARKQDLTRHQLCQHPDLRLPRLQFIVRNKSLLFKSFTVYGTSVVAA